MSTDYERLLFGELRSASTEGISGRWDRVAEILCLGLKLCDFDQIFDYLRAFEPKDLQYLSGRMAGRPYILSVCCNLPHTMFEHVPVPGKSDLNSAKQYDPLVHRILTFKRDLWVYVKRAMPTSAGYQHIESSYGKDPRSDIAALSLWHHLGWQVHRNPTVEDLDFLLKNVVATTSYGVRTHPLKRNGQTQGAWMAHFKKDYTIAEHPMILKEIAYLEDVMGFRDDFVGTGYSSGVEE